MKTFISKGTICVNGPYHLLYKVCDIFYYLNSDDTFKYVFKTNYPVIDLIESKYFQGIPGLNLDLRKLEYIRENKTPTFISERVPSKNREDYLELLSEVNMDYMDPIEYLLRTKMQYSGDKLFLKPYEDKKTIVLNEDGHETNNALIKMILQDICFGNDIIINSQKIDDSNRKMFHDIFIDLYARSYKQMKTKQKEGIEEAKASNKYKGRKPIQVDTMKFLDVLSRVNKNEISYIEAVNELGISVAKYYRLKKKLET